jgi:hypothetical protein
MTTHTIEWMTALLVKMGIDPNTGERKAPEPEITDFLPCQEYGLEEVVI